MGILKKTGKVAGHVVNVRVDRWVNLAYLGETAANIGRSTKGLFNVPVAERNEAFDEALDRLDISDVDLYQRRREFTYMMGLYIGLAVLVFGYGVLISIGGNFMGFCMSLGVTVYALSHAFKYHFWLYQIKRKKLGCSLQDWLNADD